MEQSFQKKNLTNHTLSSFHLFPFLNKHHFLNYQKLFVTIQRLSQDIHRVCHEAFTFCDFV